MLAAILVLHLREHCTGYGLAIFAVPQSWVVWERVGIPRRAPCFTHLAKIWISLCVMVLRVLGELILSIVSLLLPTYSTFLGIKTLTHYCSG